MVASDCVEHLLLRRELAENTIKAILVLAVIDHGLIVPDIRGHIAGPEPAVDLDVIAVLLGARLAGVADRGLLIISRAFDEGLRQVDGDFVNRRIAFKEVGPWWRGFG